MNAQEFARFHDERYAELPADVLRSALQVLDSNISHNKAALRQLYDKAADKAYWMSQEHFYFGMSVRNMFRQAGLKDALLPSGNWDDYYVQVLEVWIGVRPPKPEFKAYDSSAELLKEIYHERDLRLVQWGKLQVGTPTRWTVTLMQEVSDLAEDALVDDLLNVRSGLIRVAAAAMAAIASLDSGYVKS